MISGVPFYWGAQTKIQEGVFCGVCMLPVVRPFCSTLSFDRPLELQVFQLGIVQIFRPVRTKDVFYRFYKHL